MLDRLLAKLRVQHEMPEVVAAPASSPHAAAPPGEPQMRVPDEIEALLAQVQLAYEQQSRLIRGIGHDFKSPLASILRSSEALATGEFGEMTPEQAETCRLIAESAQHLMAIAQALYAVGDAGEDGTRFEQAAIDVRGALARTVDAHRSAALAKGLELTLSVCNEGPLPVCAAQGTVERIIGNVLHNAVKFTFEGSVTVTCRADEDTLVIVIDDTGIGIPEADLGTIGAEFVRGSNAGDISGSGVGLAVTRHLLDRIGGSLSVSSELGVGSHFTIDMPLAHAACEERL